MQSEITHVVLLNKNAPLFLINFISLRDLFRINFKLLMFCYFKS